MKKVQAFGCEFCNKILRSRSGMSSHESKCFKNPKTHSCITCKHLSTVQEIDQKELTKEEIDILNYKIEGTYSYIEDGDPEGDGEGCNVLNDEYQYLYESIVENYCVAQNRTMYRLATNCDNWKLKAE